MIFHVRIVIVGITIAMHNVKSIKKAKEIRDKRNVQRRMGMTADSLSGRVVGMKWWS